MRWIVPGLCLFALLAWAPGTEAAAASAVPLDHWEKNLAPNPGLELDANGDGKPDGWGLPYGQCVWDAAEKHSGTRSLRFTNTDKKLYRLIIAEVDLVPDARYRFSAWVKGKDIRDGDPHRRGAGLCLEWFNAKGQWLGGEYPKCKAGTFDWTHLKGETGPVPAETARGRLILYMQRGTVGAAWFDDVEARAIRRPMLVVRLIAPAYRATLEAPTKGKKLTVEMRVNRREHGLPRRGLRLQASLLDAAGRGRATLPPQPAPEDERPAGLSWRLPDLPAGAHTLAVRLLDGVGKQLADQKKPLRVAQPSKRKVTIDERGRLIADGRPFFPLGLYLGATEDEHLERIAKGGFNTILCYGYGTGKDPRAYLDRAHRHGLEVIYSVMGGDINVVRKYVTDLRDHPAILAWYTNDELGPTWVPQLKAGYDLACQLDPNHPTFQVLCNPSQFHLYYDVTDVLGCDPYPVPRHPITMVGEWMDTARAGMCEAKPTWCVAQIFQWAVYSHKPKEREPTYGEKRAMVFLALIHRAQGLICYSYFDLFRDGAKGQRASKEVFERRWKEVSAIAGEVRQLMPALLEGKEVGADRKGIVRHRILEYNNAAYVIGVNTDPGARSKLTVRLPKRERATRIDTQRELQLQDGKLVDELGPLEAAIYVAK